MSHVANAINARQLDAASLQKYAKISGVLFLFTIFGGGFGEFYVPSTIVVTGDAAATASNIIASNTFYRLGFAAYLVEAICDIGLSWSLYFLLRPVRRDLALLAAFFGLVATAVFAGGELFFFAPTFILGGADYLKSFTPDQLNSLALLSLRFYGVCAAIFMAFYGIAAFTRGYLIYRSTYLPKFLGVLLMLGGLGFVSRNFVFVLAPGYASDLFLIPMMVAGLSMAFWFLVKGINVNN